MKYTKTLLSRDERDVQDEQFYGELFEALNNEKTLEEFVEKALKRLSCIEGPVHVVRKKRELFEVVTDIDNENKDMIVGSSVFKKIKETKKPFFGNGEEVVYAGFPLNLKGIFIGALIIEDKQQIKEWREIYTLLHMLIFSFRFYELVEKERNVSIKDMETGLYNERHFYNHFEIEEEKFSRFKTPMTLVLFEVSNIKNINDELGYEFGEKVLKYIGGVVENQSRKIDMPARIDKGVFAVLLSSTPEVGGEKITNRVKMIIENEVKVGGKVIPVNLKSAFAQYKTHHTKENFLEEIYKKLR